jgi:thiol-disulfide isomerase/thioredoxin
MSHILRMFSSPTGFAIAGLVAVLELSAEVAAGTLVASPSFGPLRFRGQPLELVFAGWFLAVLALETAIRAGAEEVGARMRMHRLVIASIGFAGVLWGITEGQKKALPYQYWIAGACAASIFVISALSTTVRVFTVLRHSWTDFNILARRPLTWGAAGIALALLAWGPRTLATESIRSGTEFERWFVAQPRVEFPVPASDRRLFIAEFVDYQCPYCKDAEARYEPLFNEFETKYRDKIRFVRYDFPLERECNGATGMRDVHPGACEAAIAIRIAKETGKDRALAAWLWTNQLKLSRDTVFAAFKEHVGGDISESRYEQELALVKQDATLGQKLAVKKTPMFWVNGVLLSGISLKSFRWAIEHELAAMPASALAQGAEIASK